MYAIIEDSGTQIKVSSGDVLDVDLRDHEGSSLTFDRVLALKEDENSPATLGRPYIEGASVKAEVLDKIKGEKIDVIRFKRRKGHRTKIGHRQKYLRIRIESIDSGSR